MASVGTSIVPPGPRPPPADTPGTSAPIAAPQVTALHHDFAVSLPLFPNPVVAESLLDRLINNSHQAFMNGPSYRPNKSPGRVVPTGNTSAS